MSPTDELIIEFKEFISLVLFQELQVGVALNAFGLQ